MLIREGRKILIDYRKQIVERKKMRDESTIRIFSSNVETIYKATKDPVFLKTLHDTLGVSVKNTTIKFDSSSNTLTIKSGLSFYPQTNRDKNWNHFTSLFQIDYDVALGKPVQSGNGEIDYWKYTSDRRVVWTIDPKNISVNIERLGELKKSYNGILPVSRQTSFQTKDAKDIARAIRELTIELIKSKCSNFDSTKFAPEKMAEDKIMERVMADLSRALVDCAGHSKPTYYEAPIGEIKAMEYLPLVDKADDNWLKYSRAHKFDAKTVLLMSFIPKFSFHFTGKETEVKAELLLPTSLGDKNVDDFSIESREIKRIIKKGLLGDMNKGDIVGKDILVHTIMVIKEECIQVLNQHMKKLGTDLQELKIDLHKIDVEDLLDKLSGFSTSSAEVGDELGIKSMFEIMDILSDLNMVSNGYKKTDDAITYFISYPIKVNGEYTLMPIQVHFDAKTKSFIRSSVSGKEIYKKILKNGMEVTEDEFEDAITDVLSKSEPKFKKTMGDNGEDEGEDNIEDDEDSDKEDSRKSKDKYSKNLDSKASQYDFIQKLVVNNPNINKTYGKGTGVRWDKDAQYYAFQMNDDKKVGHVKIDGDKANLVVGRKLLDTVDLGVSSVKDAIASLRGSLAEYAEA